jgi:hypothetical protein
MATAHNIGSVGDLHRAIGVDTIIRFHDANAIGELDKAIFSIFHQSYTSVCPIVVTQGLDESVVTSVRSIVERHNWSSREIRPTIVNVENNDNCDIRSKLLNVGLRVSTGRYFSILDADDYLYGHALRWLVSNLQNGKFAISFGDIVKKNVALTSGISYTYGRQANVFKGDSMRDLLSENFCPIHSFVVDKHLVEEDDLYFNEDMCRLEDYDFLLVHQSYLVNAEYIRQFDPRASEIELSTGFKLATSQSGTALLRAYFARQEERKPPSAGVLARMRTVVGKVLRGR